MHGDPGRVLPLARVILVDDHELVRAGLRRLLRGERGLEIVGEASDGREGLALCRRLRPELVLLDVHMPDTDGLSVTRAIKQEFPATRVVVVTLDDSPRALLWALRSGVDGYVLKGTPKRELTSVIRRALRRRPVSRRSNMAVLSETHRD
jgi:DNA-binding NarL/FixJ family response regulator